jgi:succinate dehydrogenase / fumarate reductase flavoprotein subunit
MSNIPGLFVAGEANFSDHGANRLGASALMQGLADGFFVLPYVIGNYLAQAGKSKTSESSASVTSVLQESQARFNKLIEVGQKGSRTVDDFHRKLGTIIWDNCGMARNPADLKKAITQLPELREEFFRSVKITGSGESLNRDLEKAGRVADFFELGELMCRDALERDESCGCHFREDHQADGECVRDDERFAYAAAWEWRGQGAEARDGNHALHKEQLSFEYVKMAQRSYK